jgi:hypothetical protein
MSVRDKIAEMLCDADEWGLTFDSVKANKHFAPDIERYYAKADAILAIEHPSKKIWRCAKHNIQGCVSCSNQFRPATIGDLTGE